MTNADRMNADAQDALIGYLDEGGLMAGVRREVACRAPDHDASGNQAGFPHRGGPPRGSGSPSDPKRQQSRAEGAIQDNSAKSRTGAAVWTIDPEGRFVAAAP